MGANVFHRASQCKGKATFRNFRIASLEARTVSNRYKERIEPYHCPHCHGFHVGHAENRSVIAKAFRRAKQALIEAELDEVFGVHEDLTCE